MDIAFQMSSLAVVTLAIEFLMKWVTSPSSVTNSNNQETIRPAELPSKTIQTTKWIYSSTPNALLFDFSTLNMKKEQFLPMIKSALPLNVTALIHPIGELLAEIVIIQTANKKGSFKNTLYKQVYSILKNRGLHLKDKNIWLKPTPTLSPSPNLVFWRLRLCEYPISMATDAFKKQIAEAICSSFQSSSFKSKRKYDCASTGKGVTISSDNIFFSDALSPTDQECNVIILAKEYTNNLPFFINPMRKLIYMSFLKRHLPIEIFQIE